MAAFDDKDFGLRKTKTGFFNSIARMFSHGLDRDVYEDLLDRLISADVGYETRQYLCDELERRAKKERVKDGPGAMALMEDIITRLMSDDSRPLGDSRVILLIGVNGVGKTTTRGKLARYYKGLGRKVLLAAADTFRRAAERQLERWRDRAGVDIVTGPDGRDPASVVYRAGQKAARGGYDLVICDTAGRLHNKKNLMAELGKIRRVVNTAFPGADCRTYLVLEAMTGQNAISQAREFSRAAGADGIILTKLDGTARGGSVISIKKLLGAPVKFVGVGEKIGDLMPFDRRAFARELFSGREGEE